MKIVLLRIWDVFVLTIQNIINFGWDLIGVIAAFAWLSWAIGQGGLWFALAVVLLASFVVASVCTVITIETEDDSDV